MQNDAARVVYATAPSLMLGIEVPSYNKIILNYVKKVGEDDISYIMAGRRVESSYGNWNTIQFNQYHTRLYMVMTVVGECLEMNSGFDENRYTAMCCVVWMVNFQ